MTTPTFSVIGDLYSPTQLQRALYEASQIAFALMTSYMEETPPPRELLEAYGRLRESASDAMIEHATCMKRTAPKANNG
jgi:hypothetical protein